LTVDDPIIQRFHDLFWYSRTWRWTFWQGIPVLKCPLDLWIYQELLWQLRPQLVVELGTWAGGTAHFIADNMDLYGADERSHVVSVDILDDEALTPHVATYAPRANFDVRIRPVHHRITYIHGDSVSDETVQQVQEFAADRAPIMVIADSDHSMMHSYMELVRYHELVTPGSWFVMEDTDGPGPRRAVDEFLANHGDFTPDLECEKFFMTFNPRGYLRRRGIQIRQVIRAE
jgi:cephalosporin hydroxylase